MPVDRAEFIRNAKRQLLQECTPEERLEGLTPAQILQTLTPEQILQILTKGKGILGLTSDERKELLSLLDDPVSP